MGKVISLTILRIHRSICIWPRHVFDIGGGGMWNLACIISGNCTEPSMKSVLFFHFYFLCLCVFFISLSVMDDIVVISWLKSYVCRQESYPIHFVLASFPWVRAWGQLLLNGSQFHSYFCLFLSDINWKRSDMDFERWN